jgi:hypothetical protein
MITPGFMKGPLKKRLLRLLGAAALGAVLAVLPSSMAAADPAGPTDYRSEVTNIVPTTAEITARVVAGDSFLKIEVLPGSEVIVKGYAAEPYLRIDAEGVVWENQRSPATYYNAERYGADIPSFADPTAEPEWKQIGSGHRWSWHDHRIHRMETFPPLNSSPGDQILDAVVPVLVNGQPTEIHVISVWATPPSMFPVALGGIFGLLGIGWWMAKAGRTGMTSRASLRWLAALCLPTAVLALSIGLWQFFSLPTSTGPLWTWWILPLVAVLASASAAMGARSPKFSSGAALAIAGSQMTLWVWERRVGMWRAILPTDAPWWLDRAVTAAVLPLAVVASVLGLWVLGSGFIPVRSRLRR